jgi:histidine triad (HIT) family protein
MPQTGAESKNCDFCAIARGNERSVEIVCEGKDWVAFFPLDPATPGHTLVIPREHIADLWKAEPTLAAELMTAVLRVGHAIDASLKPDGMNLITSAGRVAEQTMFHLHLHVVPRWRKDGFGEIWPPPRKYTDKQLQNVAERIRAACETTH